MEADKLLSALYCGNLFPAEKRVTPDSELQLCQRQLLILEKEMIAAMDEQVKEKFISFMEVENRLIDTLSEEKFMEGFRMGAKLVLEIYEKDDGQLQLIAE